METKPLGEFNIYINDGNYGGIYPEKELFLKEGIPLISSADFSGRTFNYEGIKFISEELHFGTLTKGHLKINDVIVVVRGSVGKVGFFKDEIGECNLNPQLAFIRTDPKELNPLFLYYLLSSKKYSELLKRFATGSVQPQLPINRLKLIPIVYPDVSTQQKIAAVLSALDAKIELNARINAELESMAKTLYDYWFVQFEFPTPLPSPLKGGSQSAGKPYKSAGGGMVWNEVLKREIPLGWEVESIENCCDIVDCLHAKKPDYEFEDENSYLLQLENIRDDGLLDLTNKYYVPTSEYKTWTSRIEVTEDDILITNAGRVAATAQVPQGIKTGIGRNITAIRPKSINPTYLFLFFRSSDMKRQVKWNMDAGAFFSSLNVKGIKKLFVIRPPKDIEDKFENIVKPMRRKREELAKESQTLTEVRDWLLPMLMNGQVRV